MEVASLARDREKTKKIKTTEAVADGGEAAAVYIV